MRVYTSMARNGRGDLTTTWIAPVYQLSAAIGRGFAGRAIV